MSDRYRSRSGWEGLLWFVMIFGGLAMQFGIMILLQDHLEGLGGWIFVVAGAPFVLILVTAVLVIRAVRKRRHRTIAAALKARGLAVELELTPAIRDHLRPHIESLQDPFSLRDGVANVDWVAYDETILIFEHTYTTGSGKSTQEHNHMVVALAPAAKYPAVERFAPMAGLMVARLRLGEGRMFRRSLGEDIQTGIEEFDRLWAIYGDRATADAFLTSEVRAILASAPKGETWSVGAGWIAVGYDQTLDGANLSRLWDRAERVAAALG